MSMAQSREYDVVRLMHEAGPKGFVTPLPLHTESAVVTASGTAYSYPLDDVWI